MDESRDSGPTHLSIVGRSRLIFDTDVASRLVDRSFSHLIDQILPGEIRLSSDAKTIADLRPLLDFLEKFNIQSTHIRIHATEPPLQIVRRALGRGLQESGLSFGVDVAENDTALAKYFVRTPSYVSIANKTKHIVVGPKGSGKSAILRHLTDDGRSALVITPENYATDMLRSLRTNDLSGQLGAYITTWKYTLLVEIFRQIVQKGLGDKGSRQQIRTYLATHNYLNPHLTLLERFVAYLRRITSVKSKVGPVELGIEAKQTDDLASLFKMGELLDLLPALRSILRRTAFTVYIDELDQSWDNSETANNFLVSLLTAAIQLRSVAESLHIFVFLRTEIFELLKPHLGQLDKLRSDIEMLSWSERELANLVASRMLYSLELDEDLPAELVIRAVFAGKISESGIDVFQYLVSRTGRRPREVIQFCNLTLDVALRTKRNVIDEGSVTQAEELFSNWRREHIVAENLYIYPGMDLLLERFRGRPQQLSPSELDSLAADAILEAQADPSAPTWLSASEPLQIVRILYSSEVIGIRRESKRVDDMRRPWENYDFVYTRPKGRVETSTSFLFHPGLWKSLELAG